jgi:acyl-CoA thioester hydrolase
MTDFIFYHPIEVRYGDLDPQGHLNNAKYLTYIEQARIKYIRHLGLWESRSFLDIGIILADAHITFKAPIHFDQEVRAGVRVARLGNKSLTMEYRLEDGQDGAILAECATTLVTYDYRSGETIPIPDRWRETITHFEGLPHSG